MACPYFLPGEPDMSGETSDRPHPPLGRFHTGGCLSGRGSAPLPLERCNLGYARGLDCFSADCGADAHRFRIGEDNGDTITVRWCIERDHRPLSWGEASWRRDRAGFEEPFHDPVFRGQIAAYVASYLAVGEPPANG